MINDRYIISQPSIERGYRLINDYALVGDCRTAALIASDASVDWLCLPAFDAEAQLSRIIGAPRGGYWSITASEEEAVPNGLQQHYHPDTAILETTIGLPVGELAVTDFMA